MGKLNTLLGIGGGSARPMPVGGAQPQGMYRPTPNGGIQTQAAIGPSSYGGAQPQNIRLQQILALRAQNGDTEAQRILGTM